MYPEHVEQATIVAHQLGKVAADELGAFKKLKYLDLGDNQLQVEQLKCMPSLRELHMPCNGIQTIDELEGFLVNLSVTFIANLTKDSGFIF